MTDKTQQESVAPLPSVILVGAGVVGEAILASHLAAAISVCIADQDLNRLQRTIGQLSLPPDQWEIRYGHLHPSSKIPACFLLRRDENYASHTSHLMIESIPERIDIKQDFYAQIEQLVPPRTVLCSNTSTLSIGKLANNLACPERLCGMHFFMPVSHREAVEVIRGDRTSEAAFQAANAHVMRLGKQPLPVQDSPGFLVNRLLSTHLNESLRMLCGGIEAKSIESASHRYGMPMSPLELIDTIGLRTVFDAGRVYWQAFPHRMDPSPLLSRLIKAKRLGRQCGKGFYDYNDGKRSSCLSPETLAVVARYRVQELGFAENQVLEHLALPMLIEAFHLMSDSVVTDVCQFNLAMSGGLGYRCPGDSGTATWLDFFDAWRGHLIADAMETGAMASISMRADDWLLEALRSNSPSVALRQRPSDAPPVSPSAPRSSRLP